MNNKINNQRRINLSLMTPLEKPALIWLASHLPAWVSSDMLTLLGFFASLLIAASYWLTQYNSAFLWLASIGFLLNWFGDSLDGTLARTRHLERPKYGFFVDHMIDSIAAIFMFIGLGLSPYINFTLALLACICYLLVSILAYLYSNVSGVFRISYIRLGPTEMRMLAILANTLVFFIGNPVINLGFFQTPIYNALVVGIILLLFIGTIIVAIIYGTELAKLEGEPGQ